MDKDKMADKYEAEYFKQYNAAHKELQDKLDMAALDSSFTDYQVENFCRRVIEAAESE